MEKMGTQKVFEEFYRSYPDIEGCKIEVRKHGHNRTIYLLTAKNGKKYIAKIGNASKDSGSSNLNDVRAQSFLRKIGCDFVPEVIYWNEEMDLHVESEVGDSDAVFDDLSKKEIDAYARQLALVHSFLPKDYNRFSIDSGFGETKTFSATDGLKVYGFERFKIVKALCPDEKVKDWLQSALRENLVTTEKRTPEKPHLKWGDIGDNLRRDNQRLYFIDWEFSSLGSGSELAYIKIHSHPSPEKFGYLVSQYAKESGRPEKELWKEVALEEKITRVNDVVWAAMKWGQAQSEEDKKKYKDLTTKRISLAEENKAAVNRESI